MSYCPVISWFCAAWKADFALEDQLFQFSSECKISGKCINVRFYRRMFKMKSWLNRLNGTPFVTKQKVLAGFLLILGMISSICSTGYLYPDEHFQILEFANAYIGRQSFGELAWEYDARIRPWFQPLIAAGLLKFAFLFNNSPFFGATVVKIFFALMFFAAAVAYVLSDGRDIDGIGGRSRKWGVLFLGTYSLIGLMIGRTSSESFATVWLFLTLAYMNKKWSSKHEETSLDHCLIGVLCGLMFYARFQMGFVYAAIGLWLVFVRKSGVFQLAVNVSGFAAIMALGTWVDSSIYGEWVSSPFNYYSENILKGVASSFGVSPWYGYFVDKIFSFQWFMATLSFVSMAVLLWKNPRSILAWVFWLFVAGHSLFAHKEERFLFPVMMVAPISWGYLFVNLQDFFSHRGLHNSVKNVGRFATFVGILNMVWSLVLASRPIGRNLVLLEQVEDTGMKNGIIPCLELHTDSSGEIPAWSKYPRFYQLSEVNIHWILGSDDNRYVGCPKSGVNDVWYEMRKVKPSVFFSRPIHQRGSKICESTSQFDRMALSMLSSTSLDQVVKIRGHDEPTLYLWACGAPTTTTVQR